MQEGRKLLVEAMRHLQTPAELPCRVGLLLHSGEGKEQSISTLESAVLASLQLPSRRSKLPQFLASIVSNAGESLFPHCSGQCSFAAEV